MVSNKLTSSLIATFVVAFLYQPMCHAKITAAPPDQFIIKQTFDHKLSEQQQHAPYEGYKYLYDYPDKGKYVYVFGKTIVTAPAGQLIIKLIFDHEFPISQNPQKYTPYDGWNYLYYYPEKGSFVYVYGKMSLWKLHNLTLIKIRQDKGGESIDKIMEFYRGCKEPYCAIFTQAIEDLKQYHGVKTVYDAYKKLIEMGYPAR